MVIQIQKKKVEIKNANPIEDMKGLRPSSGLLNR